MYITRFIPKEGPDEEYYYHTSAEAIHHMELFRDDDSELYTRVEVISETETILASIEF